MTDQLYISCLSVCCTVTFIYMCWLAKQSYNVYKDILNVYTELNSHLRAEQAFKEVRRQLDDSTRSRDG